MLCILFVGQKKIRLCIESFSGDERMRKKIVLFALVQVFVFAVCASASVDIFVSIAPQKWLVDKIGGKETNITVLVKEGQDPHTFEPTPRQVAALTNAGIWFTMDMEFESQLVRKVQKVAPELKIIDIAHHVPRVNMVVEVEEHGEEEAGHHDEDGDHGHDAHDGQDPHIWLSPLNLQIMAEKVTESLIAADEERTSFYLGNSKALAAELKTLHHEISTKLAPYTGSSFYVYHPSFGHFAKTYGLMQEAVETGGKSPTPRQLARLIGKARAEKVKVIFVQPQFDPKSAQVVASAIGGQVVPLDALAGDVAVNLKIMASRIEAALSQ
jgi:zinc transport system substrate-binding protein